MEIQGRFFCSWCGREVMGSGGSEKGQFVELKGEK
jgi:hypothetical protein